MDCIFCKIIAGHIPCLKVYEDEHTLVIMDIAEDVDGHMLAIPKKHMENIFDCDSDSLSHLMIAVKKVSNHCVDNCHYDGINLLNASGKSAGQSVCHFHIHIIPRKMNDGIDAIPVYLGQAFFCLYQNQQENRYDLAEFDTKPRKNVVSGGDH